MKMQVNISRNTLKIIAFICGIALLANASLIGGYIYKTKDYKRVDAIITQRSKEIHKNYTGNKQNTKVKYVQYIYEFNQRTYNVEMRTLLLIGKTEGTKKPLYINEENPSQIRDLFSFECSTVFFLLLGVVETFCLVALRQTNEKRRRKQL